MGRDEILENLQPSLRDYTWSWLRPTSLEKRTYPAPSGPGRLGRYSAGDRLDPGILPRQYPAHRRAPIRHGALDPSKWHPNPVPAKKPEIRLRSPGGLLFAEPPVSEREFRFSGRPDRPSQQRIFYHKMWPNRQQFPFQSTRTIITK